MQRGFTAVELALCLTIAAVLVPLVYMFGARLEDNAAVAEWQLDVAESARTVAEELRLDARRGLPTGDTVGFLSGACLVRYEVTDSALVRAAGEACGGSRGLAGTVESIAWVAGGVEVVFARVLRPDRAVRQAVYFPVEGASR